MKASSPVLATLVLAAACSLASEPLVVAGLKLTPVPFDKEGNEAKFERYAREAAAAGRSSVAISRQLDDDRRGHNPRHRLLDSGAKSRELPARKVPTPMSSICEILISESPASPMASLKEIRAVAGRGLEGDRYFAGSGTFSLSPQKPDFEVTLIEWERVDAFARESGLPFTTAHARRNLVTGGVDLNALAGREFRIGGALIRGIRLCEPCNYLAKTSFPETLRGLVHKGGLRAQIFGSGTIRVGDTIELT